MGKRRNKIKTCVITLMLMLAFSVMPVYATSDDSVSLRDKSIYETSGYRNSDCVLTANTYMIRRALILKDSSLWDDVKINDVRKKACTSPNGSSLKYEYSFSKDGITFVVKHGVLSGSSKDAKKKAIKKLLDEHPEGIVVRGKSTSGGHGVLLTGYKGKTIYAVDSAQNIHGGNKGVTTFGQTTMLSIASLTHYWYISDTYGKSESVIQDIEITNIDYAVVNGYVVLNWQTEPPVDLDGYRVYIKEVGTDDDFEKIGNTEDKSFITTDLMDGKTYKFKIRGYKRVNGHNVFTEAKTVKIKMSGEEEAVPEEDEDELED